MSTSLKIFAAGIATAFAAFAYAQSTPPTSGSPNPATGAGQRSTQNTPMGVTGTPGGGGAAAQGSTSGGMTSGSMSSGSSAAGATAGSSSGAMSGGSTAASSSGTGGGSMASGGSSPRRTARADRN